MAIILISYGSFKSKLMVEYAMVHIQQPHLPSYFESNHSFERSKHGWNIAFGITAYDSTSSQIPLDDSYGRLVALERSWGFEENNGEPGFRELKLRPCERADINFNGIEDDDENYMFYKPANEYRADAERFYSKLLCIDEDVSLMGNFNSA